MRTLLVAASLVSASPLFALTRASGDAVVTGAMGVGTTVPRATLEIGMQAQDDYALKVSSPDGSAMFLLDRSAKAGLGITPTGARLDMAGRADAGEAALDLRAGNSSASVNSAQIAFGNEQGDYRHSLRTRAIGEQQAGNGIDFYLWTASDQIDSLGSTYVASLQASTTTGLGGLHVVPSTQPVTAELVVSSGTVYGGGVILLGSVAGAPCFAGIKSGISYLGPEARDQAVRDVMALRPVSFRYAADPAALERRGLVFEEAPESVRAPNGAVVFDERLMNLELMLQAAHDKIQSLEAEVVRVERRGR